MRELDMQRRTLGIHSEGALDQLADHPRVAHTLGERASPVDRGRQSWNRWHPMITGTETTPTTIRAHAIFWHATVLCPSRFAMNLLAGYWSLDGRPARAACTRMLQRQSQHPTPASLWHEGAVALGCKTLGAPSVDHGGLELGGDGMLVLAADVRLDNRQDMLRQLAMLGSDAREISDARLMMFAFERWGIEAIGRFVGDFAIMLLDRANARIHLARDFAGQRPLFFHHSARGIAATSMAGGIHALQLVECRADQRRMLETLAGLPHEGTHSFFDSITRVEPGTVVTLDRSGKSARRYWSPPQGTLRLRSDGDYAEALAETLERAVDARLRDAGDRVATHLSAGLDSSAVTAFAAARFDGTIFALTSVPTGDLPTLPSNRFGNEGGHAAATARLYPNVDHRLIETGDRLPLEDLPWQIELFEQPDLNLPNLAWNNRINDAAVASGSRVMLVGAAGNATLSFGDLSLLRQLLKRGQVAAFVCETLAAGRLDLLASMPASLLARSLLPRSLRERLRGLGNASRCDNPVLNLAAPYAAQVLADLAEQSATDEADPVETRWRMLRRMDFGSYNKGLLLRWGLDQRDPTADRNLVELCMQIPPEQFFRNGVPRALAIRALQGRIPDPVRLEQRRGLQAANWFTMLTNARDEVGRLLDRLSSDVAVTELIDMTEVLRLYRDWPVPSASFGPLDYRTKLLRGLLIGTFVQLCEKLRGAPAIRVPPIDEPRNGA